MAQLIYILIALIYSISFIDYNARAENNEFCNSTISLTYVYRVGNQITFGAKDVRWNYDLKYRTIVNVSSNPKLSDEIVGGVAFDFDPCDKCDKHSQQFCENLANAKNLVLYLSSKRYTAYRINNDRKSVNPIDNNEQMPWGLPKHGIIGEQKFFEYYDFRRDIITGLTFVSSDENHILFASYVWSDTDWLKTDNKAGGIIIKRINQFTGIIDNKWHPIYMDYGVFGIFELNGELYALENGNIFHFKFKDSMFNGLVDEKSKLNPKELFNCYGNSSLSDNGNYRLCKKPLFSLFWSILMSSLIILSLIFISIFCLTFCKKSSNRLSKQLISARKTGENYWYENPTETISNDNDGPFELSLIKLIE